MKYSILIACVLACSCTTVRKSGSTTTTTATHTDSSTTTSNYLRETTVYDNSAGVVYFTGDSLQSNGYLPADDSTLYTQEIESAGMSIITTVRPRKDSAGKTSGIDISTKARAKPRDISVPLTKTTHTVEKGEEKKQASTVTSTTKTESQWSKYVQRVPVIVWVVLGFGVVLFLIWLISKIWKR